MLLCYSSNCQLLFFIWVDFWPTYALCMYSMHMQFYHFIIFLITWDRMVSTHPPLIICNEKGLFPSGKSTFGVRLSDKNFHTYLFHTSLLSDYFFKKIILKTLIYGQFSSSNSWLHTAECRLMFCLFQTTGKVSKIIFLGNIGK